MPGLPVHHQLLEFTQTHVLFDCVDHNKLWNILKEIRIPDRLTCLLRNLCAGQEAAVRTVHGTMDSFQIGKGVYQGCILSPCLFNFYAEYIMQNAGVNEAQVGIKIVERNIKNLRYADDTLMAESEEELKSLLRKVKEESEKAGLKLSIQNTKIMASGPITPWQIDGETGNSVLYSRTLPFIHFICEMDLFASVCICSSQTPDPALLPLPSPWQPPVCSLCLARQFLIYR